MQDPVEQAAYNERKCERADRRRAGSSFEYHSAGGNYVPTVNQNALAFASINHPSVTNDVQDAAQQLIGAYSAGVTCHHDIIHVVNEFGRAHGWDGSRFKEADNE
jgi:hypothetical protein